MVAMAYEWNENTREDDDGLLYALGFTIITDMIKYGIMKMLPLQVHPSTLMPSHIQTNANNVATMKLYKYVCSEGEES